MKTYIMQFAEKEGFAHVHFHVVPRMADLPLDRRGPHILQYLTPRPSDDRLAEEQRDELARAIQAALSNSKAHH